MNHLETYPGAIYPFSVDYETEPALGETLEERDGIEVVVRGTVNNYTGGPLQSILFNCISSLSNSEALFNYHDAYQNITVYNGRSGEFEIKAKASDARGINFKGNQIIKVYPYFNIYQYSDINPSGNWSQASSNTNQFLYLRQNLIIIDKQEINFVRAKFERNRFVEDNEGTIAICKKINLVNRDSLYYTLDDINIAKIELFENDTILQSVEIQRDKLELMFSDDGYNELNATYIDEILFNNATIEAGKYYKITLTIGNTKGPSIFVDHIERAYANMHLSGASTGGVAFGMFSTATENNPKFECAYPAYFYAGFSDQTRAQIANILYPVGSVYTNSGNAESPMNLYGGEWEQIDSTAAQPAAQLASASSNLKINNKVTMWVRKSLNMEAYKHGK